MTTISRLTDLTEKIDDWIEDLDNPEEWYVLRGAHATEYSVWAAEAPDEIEASEEDLPPDQRSENPNVDGQYQIGTLGWAADAFIDEPEFVTEVAFEPGKIDTRMLGLLVVHQSKLSEKALGMADGAEVEA